MPPSARLLRTKVQTQFPKQAAPVRIGGRVDHAHQKNSVPMQSRCDMQVHPRRSCFRLRPCVASHILTMMPSFSGRYICISVTYA